ncbi:hypothetical protein NIES4071_62010 [Calothrix sp. NIES-4071]|nr:hypothetical protein NIES4071_62010 [Calothrix sp. NIES-4071]BAZ60505.1 hypothetical protein NIES4105_61960 [Calothrix sp. NIES-4105]
MKLLWRWNLLIITGFLLGVNFAPSGAQTKKQLPPPNCKDPQTTRDMIECGQRNYKEASQKLSSMNKQLQNKLSTSQRKRLVASHQNWLKHRDTFCAFEAGMYEGGTLEPTTRINCYARMTNERTQELNTWLIELNRR